MKIERALKIRDRALTRIKDAHSKVTVYKLTSESYNKKYIEIINTMPNGTPSHVREYLRGYSDCLRHSFYDNLEFCYTLKDGRKFSTYKNSPLYYEKHGITPKYLHDNAETSGHYWEGTDRPFFVGPV